MPAPGPFADRQAIRTLLARLPAWRRLQEERGGALDWCEAMRCLPIRRETLRRLERLGYVRIWPKGAAGRRQAPCPSHKIQCYWVALTPQALALNTSPDVDDDMCEDGQKEART